MPFWTNGRASQKSQGVEALVPGSGDTTAAAMSTDRRAVRVQLPPYTGDERGGLLGAEIDDAVMQRCETVAGVCRFVATVAAQHGHAHGNAAVVEDLLYPPFEAGIAIPSEVPSTVLTALR